MAGSLALVAKLLYCRLLGGWTERSQQAWSQALLARLGVSPRETEDDRGLAGSLVKALQSREAPIDRLFFDWRGGRDPGADRSPSETFRALAKMLDGRQRPLTHPYWSDAEPCSMHIEEVEAIWEAVAQHDDWGPFEAKITAIRRMGEAMAQDRASAA